MFGGGDQLHKIRYNTHHGKTPPSKANHEKMSLYDPIIFPKVRYNKIVERLNRYEKLLIECLGLFKLEKLRIVDSKPIETKKLSCSGGMRRGELTAD